MFALFATTSFLIDTANMVGRPNPHSSNPMARMVYHQMVGIDPVLIANPCFVQVSVGFVSALLFGVFHLVLIYALVRGREWIRLPTFFFAGMIVMSAAVYLAVGILGDAPLFALACGATDFRNSRHSSLCIGKRFGERSRADPQLFRRPPDACPAGDFKAAERWVAVLMHRPNSPCAPG
jgi:hypothetical protein